MRAARRFAHGLGFAVSAAIWAATAAGAESCRDAFSCAIASASGRVVCPSEAAACGPDGRCVCACTGPECPAGAPAAVECGAGLIQHPALELHGPDKTAPHGRYLLKGFLRAVPPRPQPDPRRSAIRVLLYDHQGRPLADQGLRMGNRKPPAAWKAEGRTWTYNDRNGEVRRIVLTPEREGSAFEIEGNLLEGAWPVDLRAFSATAGLVVDWSGLGAAPCGRAAIPICQARPLGPLPAPSASGRHGGLAALGEFYVFCGEQE
jgi:hypothetical protein